MMEGQAVSGPGTKDARQILTMHLATSHLYGVALNPHKLLRPPLPDKVRIHEASTNPNCS